MSNGFKPGCHPADPRPYECMVSALLRTFTAPVLRPLTETIASPAFWLGAFRRLTFATLLTVLQVCAPHSMG